MAQTNNGTVVAVQETLIPVNYTRPTVTRFNDYKYTRISEEITITKSTVDTTPETDTLTALVAAVNTAAAALVTADFIQTNTITMFSILKNIESNDVISTGNFYTDDVDTYICTVDIFIKTA